MLQREQSLEHAKGLGYCLTGMRGKIKFFNPAEFVKAQYTMLMADDRALQISALVTAVGEVRLRLQWCPIVDAGQYSTRKYYTVPAKARFNGAIEFACWLSKRIRC